MLTNMSKAFICLLALLNGFSAATAMHPAASAEILDGAAYVQQQIDTAPDYQQFELFGRDILDIITPNIGVGPIASDILPVLLLNSPVLRHDLLRQ